MRFPCALLVSAAVLAACGGGKKAPAGCDPGDPAACASGQACEQVVGAVPACVPALVLRGTVSDLATHAPVAGARLVALDANRAPASAVAVSAADGSWELQVPAARQAGGAPSASSVTLRADASGHQSFPGGLRTALPIDLSSASFQTDRWVVQGALTAVGLLPLPPGSSTAAIHGTVAGPPSGGGVLVVAEPAGGGAGFTGVADRDGSYAVLNLPAAAGGASYRVKAYALGANYDSPTVTLAPGDDRPLNLALAATPTTSVSGTVSFVAGGVPPTSVTLVVESTYLASLDRGESPPGLRAAGIGGSYTFAGVPDGSYIVLAAFDVDANVRDVSGIGGTAPVVATVQGGALTTAPAIFKITSAVDLHTIDGTAAGATPVALGGATPAFTWAPYASTDHFRVKVFDDQGVELWSQDQAAVSGTNSATYAGPALAAGHYYQLRIAAIHVNPSIGQISQTEDLKGVFYLP